MVNTPSQLSRVGHEIQVRGLSKRYGRTIAVDNLTFTVRSGIVTGFVGPNGAGKTTTMRLILGLDSPTAGAVTVGGRRYRDFGAPLREVGAIIDAQGVHPRRSAFHHLLAAAQSNGIPKRRVDEVLGQVGLAGAAARRVGDFSLGMKQRLAIAGALLGDPPVLMFDEPINGLDPEGIIWVRGLMRELAAQGRTVFVSSHLMSEMSQTADHLIVIGKGRLLRDESVTEFLDEGAQQRTLVRAHPQQKLIHELEAVGAVIEAGPDSSIHVSGIACAAIGELAATTGVTLHELTPLRVSLEDAFVEATHGSLEYQTPKDAA